MAVLIRPRRWGWTPPAPGSSIEWGHPFADRLELLHAHPWMARPLHMPATTIVGTTGTPTFDARGTLITNGKAVTYTASTRWDAMYQSSVGYSVAAIYVSRSTVSDETHFLSRDDSSGATGSSGSGRRWQFRLNNGTGASFIAFNDAVGNASAAATNAARDGKLHMLVGVCDWTTTTGNLRIALDGRIAGTGNLSGTHANTATTNLYTASNGTGTNSAVIAVYAWSRPLRAEEIAWLWAEPYALVAPPAPRVSYFALDTVTLPTITAAATLPGLTAAATLAPSDPITAAATLPGLTGAATLAPSDPISAAATLPALTGAAVLAPSDPMTAAATLPALTAAATLAPAAPFTGAATLPALTAAAVLGRIPAPRGVVTLTDTAARGTITVANTTSRGRITVHDAAARGTITVE